MARKFFNWGKGNGRRGRRQIVRRRNPLRNSDLRLERLEDRRLLAAGDLDTTFNPAGPVPGIKIGQFAPFGLENPADEGVATAVQADGKIVVATQRRPASGNIFSDVLVARYNADGSADTTFGSGGSTAFDFGSSGSQSLVRDVAIDNLGRIIVVGAGPSASNFAAARLTSTGLLDNSFGTLGIVSNNFGIGNGEALAVAIQADGKIVMGGVMGGGGAGNFALIRYNTNGSLDDGSVTDSTPGNSFGVSGRVTTDFHGGRDAANDLIIQSDGKIVAVGVADTGGSESRNFALARYNVDGTLDTSFGPSLTGKVSTEIVTAAAQPGRLSSDDTAWSAKLQSDGSIIVGGTAGVQLSLTVTDSDMVIARYTSGGLLDSTFLPDPALGRGSVSGTHRVTVAPLGTLGDFGKDVLIQPDGKYVIAGMVNTSGNFTITLGRVLNNGSLDTTFSGDGLQQTSLGAAYQAGQTRTHAGALTPEGNILVVGSGVQSASPNNADYWIARYQAGITTISGPPTVAEGATYNLTLASSDPTTSQWTINWGDSSQIVSGNPSSVTHTYADGPQNYTISATVTTSTGTVPVANTVAVSVLNVSPTLTISGGASLNEGSTYILNLSSTDPGPDTITSWTINWGDSIQTVAGNPSSVTHTYADGNASYTISASATDEDGTFAAGNTVPVTVNNVAPTLTISGAATVNESSTYTLNLSSSDPGADTITQWTINWGDSIQVVGGNPSSVTHTYADGNANYTISATATDEDGTFSSGNTVAVTVQNVAPALTISGASDVNEGSSYSLSLSSSDPGADTISQWTINWGDATEIVSGNPASVTHTYADGNASYTISATATDEDGTYSANTVGVTVHDVAPTLAISGASSVNEGSSYSLSLSSSEPGADTISQWTINWGDSTEVVSGNPASVAHTYADGDANYSISATATNEDGTFTAGNVVLVAVANVAPALVISGASDTDEGSAYVLNLSSFDPGADTISQWTINWGDTTEVVSGNPTSVSHTYADGDASYTISATATDEDNTFAAGNTVNVAVHNVAPALAISGAASVNEGTTYTLNLSSLDPGTDTIMQWTINWGDTTEVVTGNPTSVAHTYADGNAGYTISATATDEDGTFSAGNTVSVTVSNVAPALTISGAAGVNEGSSYTLNLSSLDPGTDTITQWTINWGDSTQVVSGNPASVSHTYADGNASYTISATATDEDGTFAAGNSVSVTVNNVAPTLAISGAASVNEGSSYTLNLSSSDPGADTITSWTINWGDSTQVVSGNPASISHTYADGSASYSISATATDEDGTFTAGNTVALTVSNVAPTLTISGAASVNEGSSYSLNLSSSDPGADTITSWTINWGDSTQVVSGNPASVSHVYADGTVSFTISATATDEDGTFSAGNTVAVTVQNVAPTANAGGPYATFDDTPITLTGTGTDPAGAADPLTFAWDLDGDNIFGETGVGATRGNEAGASVTYDPNGLPVSTQTVSLRVSDGDGGVTTTTTTVGVIGVGSAVVGGVLYITGTNSHDIAVITKVNTSIMVVASFNANNPMLFAAASITEIQVRMRGGHDVVVTTPNVDKVMTIDGGSGNDLLTGGGARNLITGGTGHDILHGGDGDDVMLGGDGNDDLFGGNGNDILVGGNGNDILHGGGGRDVIIGSQDEDMLQGGNDEDILIGGWTSHDSNVAALDAIMAIWGSAATFSSRVATLTGSGGLLQAGVTVFDDDDHDTLVGNAGRDLYFGDNNPSDGVMDQITLQAMQDQLVAVT